MQTNCRQPDPIHIPDSILYLFPVACVFEDHEESHTVLFIINVLGVVFAAHTMDNR